MPYRMLRLVCAVGALSVSALVSATPNLDPLTSQIQPLAVSSLVLDIGKAGDTLVAVGDKGHVLLHGSSDEAWHQVDTPVTSLLTKVFFLDAKLGWAVGHDATIIHTRDGGQTWTVQMQAPEIEKPLFDVLFFNANEGIAVGAYGLFYRTLDGGEHWQEEFHQELLFEEDVAYLADLKANDEAAYLSERASLLAHFNRIIPLKDGRLLLAGELGMLAVSADKGRQFSRLELNYEGSMFNAIELDDAVYVMGLRGHVFKSDSSLQAWQPIAIPASSSINAALAGEHDDLTLIGNAGVIIEVNGSGQASLLARRQGENLVAMARDAKGNLWLAGSQGLVIFKQ
ncbi:YCF48-related protein [Shewanella sp. AS16]|uniref:WD40/YVTN/BNR-like repeat-containing protein n=1 Tax=Shewanella sp. AS16 TaxID=2907625 RepID=UPI001F44411A|nr:YCF48-related protein [Shewanella sp. AS16]MCE9684732.1 YCF48-related protein [Shewanella sp. AS16]